MNYDDLLQKGFTRQADGTWAKCPVVGGLVETPAVAESCGTEKDLHDQIEAECRKRIWPYIHSRMDMMSTISVGAPDFVIAAEGGRTFWIECKTKNGKQTIEQKGWQLMLEKNHNRYHIVRSFSEFLEIVK